MNTINLFNICFARPITPLSIVACVETCKVEPDVKVFVFEVLVLFNVTNALISCARN